MLRSAQEKRKFSSDERKLVASERDKTSNEASTSKRHKNSNEGSKIGGKIMQQKLVKIMKVKMQ